MSDNRTCRCGRRMVVLSSRRVGAEQARYLACRTCGHRRTVLVDASEVFRRLSTVEQEQLGVIGSTDTMPVTPVLRR